MLVCEKCEKIFKTKTKLKKHKLRMRPCKVPEYYCVLCKKGLGSYRTMWAHKRTCMKRMDSSFEDQERVQRLKKRVTRFFSTLSSDFPAILGQLEKLFPPHEESLQGNVRCKVECMNDKEGFPEQREKIDDN